MFASQILTDLIRVGVNRVLNWSWSNDGIVMYNQNQNTRADLTSGYHLRHGRQFPESKV